LAIRIPKALADELGIREGTKVDLTVSGGSLQLTPAAPPTRRYTLAELVAGITPENTHEELDWGPPVGTEEW
jgi:antitoxin MazE